MRQKGFSLVELLVVLLIIAILAALAIPKFREVSRKAKAEQSAVAAQEKETADAVDAFTPSRIKMLGWRTLHLGQDYGYDPTVIILRDTASMDEYMIVQSGKGVAVEKMTKGVKVPAELLSTGSVLSGWKPNQ